MALRNAQTFEVGEMPKLWMQVNFLLHLKVLAVAKNKVEWWSKDYRHCRQI